MSSFVDAHYPRSFSGVEESHSGPMGPEPDPRRLEPSSEELRYVDDRSARHARSAEEEEGTYPGTGGGGGAGSSDHNERLKDLGVAPGTTSDRNGLVIITWNHVDPPTCSART